MLKLTGLTAPNTWALSNRFTLPSRRMVVFGDSRAAQESTRTVFDQTGTVVTYESVGMMNWARFVSRQKFDFFDIRDNFGVGGENSTQTLARLQTALASAQDPPIGAIRWLCGTNDRSQGFTDLQTEANFAAAVALAQEARIPIFFHDDYPRGDATFTAQRLTQPQLGYHYETAKYVRSVLHNPAKGVFAVEGFKDLENFTLFNGDVLTGDTQDGLHQNILGAINCYQSLGGMLGAIWPPRDLLADYATNNLFTNPDLAGSGGAVGGVWSGSLPTGWTGSGSSGAVGAAAAYSSFTDPDGNVWGKVALSGTPSGAGAEISFRQDLSSGYAQGQTMDMGADFIIDSPVNLEGVSLRCLQQATAGGTTVFDARDMDRLDTSSLLPATLRVRGQERIGNVPVQAGVGNVRASLSIFTGAASQAIGGTVYFRRPKLIAA